MVVCNHPAAYDAAILGACIQRDDLKMMASDIPLIQMLPNVAEHMIPVPYDIPARLQTVRSTIRHLQNGGAVLVFPRGDVEPDPAISPGAEQSLDRLVTKHRALPAQGTSNPIGGRHRQWDIIEALVSKIR